LTASGKTSDYDTGKSGGRFVRSESQLRNCKSARPFRTAFVADSLLEEDSLAEEAVKSEPVS
jgi:hypothetical protein